MKNRSCAITYLQWPWSKLLTDREVKKKLEMEAVIDCPPDSPDGTLTMTLPHFKEMKKPTMSQTYQYLNKLISSKKAEEFENLSELISADIPLSLFETNLQLILIDSLHLENEVSRILLSQNDNQIERVLKCKWFFKSLTFEYCANQLFPFISVSLRCKIINKLSRHLQSAEEAEKYFTFIRNTYDNERAEYLLPRCSPEFIINYVETVNNTFEFNTGLRILLNICKRYVEVGIRILSSIFEAKKENHYELIKYKKILLYFGGYHADAIVPFLKKYLPYVPSEIFGRKLTKKLKSKVKEQLFTDFMKHLIFKKKHLFSMLNFEEKIKMIAKIVIHTSEELTFNSWKVSNDTVSQLIKLVPAKDRLKMVELAFKEVYNRDYNDHASCWSSEILELIPTESRQPYVIKLEKILNTEVWDRGENERDIAFDGECLEKLIYLYDSRTALEKFKDLVRKTPSVERRESILPHMVKNCAINNDLGMLEEMVEFIVVHHRNDDAFMLYRFINCLCGNFSPSSLNLNICKNLEDLIYYLIIKRYEDLNVLGWVKERRIYYLLENNMNVDSHVEDLLKSVVSKWNYFGSFVIDLKSNHSKTLIMIAVEKAIPMISIDSWSENFTFASLLCTSRDYNKENKHDPVSLKDLRGLEGLLRAILKEKYVNVGAEDWPLDVWEKYYHKALENSYKLKCLMYVIKRNPNIIDGHLEGILEIFFYGPYLNYSLYKKHIKNFMMIASFFEKTDEVKELTLKKFTNEKTDIYEKKNVLMFYSCICTIEEFNKVVEEYLPKQERLEQQSEDFDTIQMLIPKLIKNIRPRWKNLPLILKFYLGDFLKTVLPSFYSCCYYMRYDHVMPFLKEQLDAVSEKISYRIPIIRLILELSEREEKFSFFLKCWDEYKHYSVRSILLVHISKTFLDVQSQKSFQVLKKCILDCGPEVIKSRPDWQKVPKKFLNDYICALWQFSKNQKNPFRNKFQDEVLSCFNRFNISFLSPEFCESVIKDNLFSPSSELQIFDFTVAYLVVSSETVECRLRMVLDLIKERKPNPRSVYDFVNVLIVQSLDNSTNFVELFKVLLENWPEYPNAVLFEERILLNYHFLYQRVLKRGLDSSAIPVEFGKELKNFFSNINNLSDLFVIYARVLEKFFNQIKTFEVVFAVKELIEDSRDRTLAVLVIISLPEEAVIWHNKKDEIFDKIFIERKKVLSDIIKTLESYNDEIVEIYLRSKFDFV